MAKFTNIGRVRMTKVAGKKNEMQVAFAEPPLQKVLRGLPARVQPETRAETIERMTATVLFAQPGDRREKFMAMMEFAAQMAGAFTVKNALLAGLLAKKICDSMGGPTWPAPESAPHIRGAFTKYLRALGSSK